MENIEIIDLEQPKNTFSVLKTYGDDLTARNYITNPAIARDEEIKKVVMTLLTPEKSALLVGKPGIGKTAIVEGLAYLISRNEVPDVIKGYKVIKLNSSSLTSKVYIDNREEIVITLLIDELKSVDKVIIFIDEIHTLIGNSDSLDLANRLKPALDRGEVKAIGATTTNEYDKYIIRDRAFLRRFERIDVLEPDEETTVKILVGTLPKIERKTGIKFKYNDYVSKMLIESIVSATTEYKRVYGLSAMYPDVSFSVLTQAFSQALFKNKTEVNVEDVYNAIKTSKRIYPDSIIKELAAFKIKFKDLCAEEGVILPTVLISDIQTEQDGF
jgi:ATP-dependent Clp protease ATP-binding subunit ClpC